MYICALKTEAFNSGQLHRKHRSLQQWSTAMKIKEHSTKVSCTENIEAFNSGQLHRNRRIQQWSTAQKI